MPLLLKTKKDLVKSFQFGGATNFYSTFTVKDAGQPLYNPGALLEAYNPIKKLAKEAADGKVQKARELPKLELDGKGHSNDNDVAAAELGKKRQVISEAINSDAPESTISRLENEYAVAQQMFNNNNANAKEATVKAEVSSFTEGKAKNDAVYQDGSFFGTYSYIDDKGKIQSTDKPMSALEVLNIEQENKEHFNNKTNPTRAFNKMSYGKMFENRDRQPTLEYLFGGGQELISTIGANGMSIDVAKKQMDEKFNMLGYNDQQVLNTVMTKAKGETSFTSSAEWEGSNKDALEAVRNGIKNNSSPQVRAAIEREAWDLMQSKQKEEIFKLPKEDQNKAFAQLHDKLVDYVIDQSVAPKLKIKSSNKEIKKELQDLTKAGSLGGAADKFVEVSKPELDVIAGPDETGFLETLVVDPNVMIQNMTDLEQLDFDNFGIKPKAEGKIIVDKNIAAELKMKHAPFATQIVENKIDHLKKDKEGNAIEFLSVNKLASGDDNNITAFSNMGKATTLNNVDLKPYLDHMSVMDGAQVKVVWMPTKRNTKEFLLSGDNPEEKKRLSTFIENFNSDMSKLETKVSKQEIDALKFGQEYDALKEKYNKEFKDYDMVPHHKVTAFYNEALINKPSDLEKIKLSSSPALNNDAEKSWENQKTSSVGNYINTYDFMGDDDYRTVDVFIEIPNFAVLRSLGGKKVTENKTDGTVGNLIEENKSTPMQHK